MIDTDLRAVVGPTVRMFDRVSERHPVLVNIPDVPVMIHADPDLLQRLLENLLTNAIKYSPAGGAVEVEVGVEGASAAVRVRDHGIGISPAALPHIFKGSFRAPEALATAPGLGLASVSPKKSRIATARRSRHVKRSRRERCSLCASRCVTAAAVQSALR